MIATPKTAFFQFHPAPAHGAFGMDDYWIWCASPILGDDGRYHLFASRWPKTVTMFQWATNSEIVRASADKPEGPYQFEEVILEARGNGFWDGMVTHNPTIHCYNGTYLLFYTGTTYQGSLPKIPEEGALFSPKWLEAWNNKRIGLATAPSILGPWTRADQPLLLPRPGKWDSAITSNAAVCVREDGRIILIYKSADQPHTAGHYKGRFHLGAATAPHWSKPFVRLSDGPIDVIGHPNHHLEDPYIWWNGSRYEMVAKDMTGEVCGEPEAGIHATSPDAQTWTLSSPARAYTRTMVFEDGRTVHFQKRERPQFLIENGRPTHLFAAVLETDGGGWITNTWSSVAPLV